jgi:hypothetical protein
MHKDRMVPVSIIDMRWDLALNKFCSKDFGFWYCSALFPPVIDLPNSDALIALPCRNLCYKVGASSFIFTYVQGET